MKKILFIFASVLIAGTSFSQTQQDPDFQTGQALKASEDYKGAIAAYDRALKTNPKNINALLQKAFCEGALGSNEAAITDYTEVLKINPDHKFSYLSRGSAYLKLKKYNEAISDYDKVLTLDPKDQEAYNNRGWAKKNSGDSDGACKDWNKSKKLGNDEAKIILKNNKCK